MGNITVDPKGVAKLLDGLNVHKAPGPDGLNARVLKECSNEISPILALIFNESLARGDVPDEWRQANVSPVFKKGEKYDAASPGLYHSGIVFLLRWSIPRLLRSLGHSSFS